MKKNCKNHKISLAEFLVKCQKWQLKKGLKRPSLPFYQRKAKAYLTKKQLTAYVCSNCGASHVKLWRPYGNSYVTLLCAKCASKREKKNITSINSKGCRVDELGEITDQIGEYVPAIPMPDSSPQKLSYYGYLSCSQAGSDWWRGMPTLSPE